MFPKSLITQVLNYQIMKMFQYWKKKSLSVKRNVHMCTMFFVITVTQVPGKIKNITKYHSLIKTTHCGILTQKKGAAAYRSKVTDPNFHCVTHQPHLGNVSCQNHWPLKKKLKFNRNNTFDSANIDEFSLLW